MSVNYSGMIMEKLGIEIFSGKVDVSADADHL